MGVEMPDIGGFGRGLVKGALSATEKAADKVKDAAETASRKIEDEPRPVENAAAPEPEPDAADSDVSEVVDMFRRLLAEHRPPPGQVYDGWSMGVGDVLASLPKVPKRVRGLI